MRGRAAILAAAVGAWLSASGALIADAWSDYGIDPRDVETFASEAEAGDAAAAFRIVDRLRVLPPTTALALSGEAGVEFRRIEGTLAASSRRSALQGDKEGAPNRSLYRAIISQTSGEAATIYVGDLPAAWQVDPASGVGQRVFADAIGTDSDYIAARLGWLPNSPLGAIGFDAGLLDAVVDRKRLTGQDAPAFYGLLAAVERLDSATARLAMPADIPTLFNHPDAERGKLVGLRGVARRVLRVAVEPATAARFGFDHYFEVDLFPLESQNNPVVVCVRELPDGLGEGSDLRVNVACDAFSLKSWAFRPRSEAMASRGADGNPRLQLAPLLIAKTVAITERTVDSPGASFGWLVVLLGAVACAAVLVAARPRKRRPRATSKADLSFLSGEGSPASGPANGPSSPE